MKTLVAGGAGFIGFHLCERLLREGYRVVCVDNLLTGSRANIRHLLAMPGFRFVKADVTRPLPVRAGFDLVCNLASPASPRDYLAYPLETLRVGSIGTLNLLELARRSQALFIQASTSEIYGDPAVHPQPETYRGNVNPVGVRSVYDESKRFSEALVTGYHRHHGLAVRIARIFNTYGPGMRLDDGRVIPNLIACALAGRPLPVHGSGRQTRSFCYVSDMVEGLWRLTGRGSADPVNLGNPREVTVLRLARLILRLTGSDSGLEHLPLPEDDPRRRRPDIARARRRLGWQPRVPLEAGLRQTVDWLARKKQRGRR